MFYTIHCKLIKFRDLSELILLLLAMLSDHFMYMTMFFYNNPSVINYTIPHQAKKSKNMKRLSAIVKAENLDGIISSSQCMM